MDATTRVSKNVSKEKQKDHTKREMVEGEKILLSKIFIPKVGIKIRCLWKARLRWIPRLQTPLHKISDILIEIDRKISEALAAISLR